MPDLLKSPEPFIGRLETDRHIKDAVDNVDCESYLVSFEPKD